MKVEDLKFPIVIRWFGSDYVVVENRAGELDWTCLTKRPHLYSDVSSKQQIVSTIVEGNATILAQPSRRSPITIDVDATGAVAKLAEATEAARKLESALIAVKGLLK